MSTPSTPRLPLSIGGSELQPEVIDPLADPTPVLAPVADPTPEQIGALAEEIWVNNGRPVGTEESDWLEAEKRLKAG